jgi:hypothetical protein
MKAILVNYNHDPQWLKTSPFEVILYDRSDDGIQRDLTPYGEVYRTKNFGDVDFDKLGYLIENYDSLPDCFLWGKSNLFKYVDEADLKEKCRNSAFAPLLKYDHRIYSDKWGPVNYYQDGLYHERNDNWLFSAGLDTSGRFRSWQDWAQTFMLPSEKYIPFPPGGNFILTRERVHRYSRDYYEAMRSTLPYAAHPVEAHLCERSYTYLWR